MHIVRKVKRDRVPFYFFSKINIDKNRNLVDNNCDYQKDEKVRHLKTAKALIKKLRRKKYVYFQ